jgi:hypothetical protein
VLDCYLFYAESTNRLTVEEKTNLLREHLLTRLNHDQSRAVLACAVLVDSSVYSCPPARFSITVIFYVQTRSITAIPLNVWFCDGRVCMPVPGGLCGNPEFDADMLKPAPWAVLQIFSKLALNNAGRRAQRVIALFRCQTMHQIMILFCLHQITILLETTSCPINQLPDKLSRPWGLTPVQSFLLLFFPHAYYLGSLYGLLDLIVCLRQLVWLFSPAWDGVKLACPGGSLHLPWSLTSNKGRAPGLMFGTLLSQTQNMLPFTQLVLKLVFCVQPKGTFNDAVLIQTNETKINSVQKLLRFS